MDSKSLLKEYIKELILKEKDALSNDPFGEFLFGDLRIDVETDEKNTSYETRFLNALKKHYNLNDPTSLEKVASRILKIKQSGKYLDFLKPPNKTCYRMIEIINYDRSGLKKVKDVKVFNSNIELSVGPGGILKARKPLQSWTFDKNSLINFIKTASSARDNLSYLVLKTKPKDNFIINPFEIIKKMDHKKISKYVYEELETVSIGDVPYEKVIELYTEKSIKPVLFLKNEEIVKFIENF